MSTYQKYSQRHQKKKEGTPFQKLSPDSKKQLQTDKEAYISYLEQQLERISQIVIENRSVDDRLNQLENNQIDNEEKFDNITKLIKLLQSFAETQEDENKQNKQNLKAISDASSKRIDITDNQLIELNDKFLRTEKKIENTQNSIEDIINNINEFERSTKSSLMQYEQHIEQLIQKVSRDLAADMKTLEQKIIDNQGGFCESTVKLETYLNDFRDEVNKKIEIVMEETSKSALKSDLDEFQVQFKKEAKQRLTILKCIEDLQARFNGQKENISYKSNTSDIQKSEKKKLSRSKSPSTPVKKYQQNEEIKILDSKVVDMQNSLKNIIEKVEQNQTKQKMSRNKEKANLQEQFVQKEEFQQLEKNLVNKLSSAIEKFSGLLTNYVKNQHDIQDKFDKVKNQSAEYGIMQLSEVKSKKITSEQKSPPFQNTLNADNYLQNQSKLFEQNQIYHSEKKNDPTIEHIDTIQQQKETDAINYTESFGISKNNLETSARSLKERTFNINTDMTQQQQQLQHQLQMNQIFEESLDQVPEKQKDQQLYEEQYQQHRKSKAENKSLRQDQNDSYDRGRSKEQKVNSSKTKLSKGKLDISQNESNRSSSFEEQVVAVSRKSSQIKKSNSITHGNKESKERKKTASSPYIFKSAKDKNEINKLALERKIKEDNIKQIIKKRREKLSSKRGFTQNMSNKKSKSKTSHNSKYNQQ